MKKFPKELSFTLIELLVSIFIIILISGIIFANYRVGGQQFALQRSANKLAQDIRRAQAMAMSAQECPINKCGGPPAIIPFRYGIEFVLSNPNYYILFADRNDNGTYEPPDNEVETIPLEDGVSINELFTIAPQTGLWISFKPPDPMTVIRDPGGPRSIGGIRLIGANNQTKTITVNSAGLIEIQ
jgi:type II secretory pathway pseudopilin PulG